MSLQHLHVLQARLNALDSAVPVAPVVMVTPERLKQEPPTLLLTLAETARECRTTVRTLRRWRVPMIHLTPRATRVSRAALAEWLAKRAGEAGR